MKTSKRTVEIFTADCPLCREAIERVESLSCSSCDVVVYNLREGSSQVDAITKARSYGVTSVPAVAVNGRLLSCCQGKRLTSEILRDAGVGVP